MVKRIRDLKIEPSPSTLQTTRKTFKKPVEKIKDVLINVDKFPFYVDFMVLDIEAIPKIPLILG